jgi:hypothetical protein
VSDPILRVWTKVAFVLAPLLVTPAMIGNPYVRSRNDAIIATIVAAAVTYFVLVVPVFAVLCFLRPSKPRSRRF